MNDGWTPGAPLTSRANAVSKPREQGASKRLPPYLGPEVMQ